MSFSVKASSGFQTDYQSRKRKLDDGPEAGIPVNNDSSYEVSGNKPSLRHQNPQVASGPMLRIHVPKKGNNLASSLPDYH